LTVFDNYAGLLSDSRLAAGYHTVSGHSGTADVPEKLRVSILSRYGSCQDFYDIVINSCYELLIS